MAHAPSTSVSQTKTPEINNSEVLKQSQTTQQAKERQERRQQADKQAVAKSSNPEKAQTKLNILNTEVETNRGKMKVDDILHITPNEERMKVIQSIRPPSKILEISLLTRTSAKNQNQQAEKQNQETVKNESETTKAIDASNKFHIKKIQELESHMESDGKSRLESDARAIQGNESNPIVQELIRGGADPDKIASGDYIASIQARLVAKNTERYAPNNPAKQEAYNAVAREIQISLGMRVSANKPNTQAIVQSVVLGSDRERVTNQAMAVVESGNYSTVQYDEGSEEIVFESKSGNGRYIIDTGVVPAVSYIEKDGIQIQQEIRKPTQEEMDGADAREELQEKTEASIDKQGELVLAGASGSEISQADFAKETASLDTTAYNQAKTDFNTLVGEDGKMKSAEERLTDLQKFVEANESLDGAKRQSITPENADNPLDGPLGREHAELIGFRDILNELASVENEAQKYQKSQAEVAKRQEEFRENVDDAFVFFEQVGINKLPQETIEGLIQAINLERNEANQIRLGEKRLTNEQKQALTRAVANVLGGVNGASREEVIFSYKNHHKPHSLLQVFHQSLNTKQRKKETKKDFNIHKNNKSQKVFSIFDGQEQKNL